MPRPPRLPIPLLAALLALTVGPSSRATAQVPTPESVLGFEVGADFELATYEQSLDYFRRLDDASDRLTLRVVGRTSEGREWYLAFISSEENIARLDELEQINRRLALDPDIPEAERAALIDRGRVFILATLSMHSSEVAPAQSFPLYAHELVTNRDPAVARQMDAVVWMVVPSQNPDGRSRFLRWQESTVARNDAGEPRPDRPCARAP